MLAKNICASFVLAIGATGMLIPLPVRAGEPEALAPTAPGVAQSASTIAPASALFWLSGSAANAETPFTLASIATTPIAPVNHANAAILATDTLPVDFWSDGTLTWPDFTGNYLLPANPATVALSPVFAAAPASPPSSGLRLDDQRFERAVRSGLFAPNSIITSAANSSGTLTAIASTYNYSTAPWVITGTGTYPDGGGTATLNPVTNTMGTIITATTITIDVSPDLSQITYNSPFSYKLAAGTSTSIIADPTNGLTLNAAVTAVNSPTNFFTTFNTISSPISGGGSMGLIKTGTGIVTLTGANTYTGGTHINGGFLVIAGTAANGDAVLGATGAGNDIYINGGTLFTNVTGGLTTARNIILGASGGTIEPDTAFTTSGVVSGAGSLSINAFNALAVTLTNTNTYTGATITSLSTASALTLSGNGSIAASSSYDLSGTLTLDNSGTTGVNRLNDTGAIAARGVFITTTGNATTASAETAGALTLADGISTVNVTPGTAGSSLNFASLTRQNGALFFVRGTNLGATPGAGNSTITAGTSPATVGGGGAAGSTTISIVPSVIGNLTASTTGSNSVANSVGSTFVTYDPTNGFRPLATAEYATALGVNTTDNVRLTAATAAGSGVTANSVLFAPAAAATLSGGPINITSGAFLYSPTTGTGAGTVSAGLNFGTAEGIITATNPLTITGAIAGSGGLTIGSPTVSTITISGANTYTGTTTLVAGQAMFTGAVANDGATAGPFGLSTTAITLNAGLGYALLAATANTTFARNLLVANPASPGLDYFGGTSGLTMNGNIDMEHSLTIYAGTTTATGVVINGIVSGPGTLQGFGTSVNVTLNGNDTFTGGVNAQGDAYTLGSDTAFGTGTVFVSAASTFQGSSARTIANNFVTLAAPTFVGTFALNLTGAFNLDGSNTISTTDTATTTLSGVLSNGALTKTGTGLLVISGNSNTYTGGTVVSSGPLQLGINNGLPTAGVLTVGVAGEAVATAFNLAGYNQAVSGLLLFGGTSSVTPAVNLGGGTLTVNGNIAFEKANGNTDYPAAISGLGALDLGGAVRTFNIYTQLNPTGDLVISSVIQDGGITKAQTGVLKLSGANTYTGTTTVNAGSVIAGVASVAGTSGAFGNGSAVTLANASGANITITGFNTQIGSLAGGGTTGGTVTLGAATLTTGQDNTSTSFGGVLSGTGGALTKIGIGTQTLTGANTFTGATTINGGTLQLANTAGKALTATSGIATNSGGTLLMGAANQITGTTPVTLAGAASAATFGVGGFNQGSTTTSGVGALTLTASSTNNVIDFGSKNGVVTFASLTTNSAALTINNYLNNNGGAGGPDELIFNQDETSNLTNIIFSGYGASMEQLVSGTAGTSNAFYEVYPVPEPATVFGGVLLVGVLGWKKRRSVRSLFTA